MKSLLVPIVIGMGAWHITVAQAIPLQRNSVELPSSFERSIIHIDQIPWSNETSLGLPENIEIFSPSAPLVGSFANYASRGISGELPEFQSQSLKDLVKIASAGPLYPVTSSITNEYTVKQNRLANKYVLRDLARALVNRNATTVVTDQNQGGRRNDYPNGAAAAPSFFEFILSSQLDEEFVQTAADVINPTVGFDGFVSLNFLGLRDFAFLVSPVTNKIQIFDFKTGTFINVSQSKFRNRTSRQISEQKYEPPQQRSYSTEAPGIAIRKILKLVQEKTVSFLLHPLTVISFAVVIGCWVFSCVTRETS